MRLPPAILRIRVQNRRHRFGLWLPIFLLWPLVLAVVLVLLPFVLLGALILLPFGMGTMLLLFLPMLLRLLCALRGLELDVDNGADKVRLYFK